MGLVDRKPSIVTVVLAMPLILCKSWVFSENVTVYHSHYDAEAEVCCNSASCSESVVLRVCPGKQSI
ncbi:hypothetical protein XENTR_v10011225 [Xenopus tropicalis]|nr:hypothetical protein XENTR_v10011225 [Xenopus tropicalis]